MQLLAGQPGAAKGVKDGPKTTATFNQPRGLCKEEASGRLIVLDGVGRGAVLRTVVPSGQHAGKTIADIGTTSSSEKHSVCDNL
jgi:hypothetical protein